MTIRDNKITPYFAVAGITIATILVFLIANHQRIQRKTYLFHRDYVEDKYFTLSSERNVTHISEENIEIRKNYKNVLGYINLDSINSFMVIASEDSFPNHPIGLFMYNKINRKVNYDSCLCYLDLQGNYKAFAERLLAYDCSVSRSSDDIIISFLHFSDIFIIDKCGHLKKRIVTKENTPSPSIIKFNNFYYFERGKTYNTNIGALTIEDKLYVFSLKSQSRLSKFLVDCYDIESREYLYSFYIENAENEENMHIKNVSALGNVITIESNKSITQIKLL